MQPQQFQDLLERFSRGECSPEEEQLIMEWYASIGNAEAEPTLPEARNATEARLWGAIRPRTAPSRSGLRLISRMAAVLLPVLAAAFVYFHSHRTARPVADNSPSSLAGASPESTFRNTGNDIRELTLPDGSKVKLHPASEVVLSEDFGRASRELRLKGEAFFDVKRDKAKPFVVYSNEVTTRVLGTSFSVRAYADDREITVAVRTGTVSVFTGKETAGEEISHAFREVILTPNQQIVYKRRKQEMRKQLITEPEVILPFSSRFHMQFDNAPVSEILDALQENYGVRIHYNSEVLDLCTLTTSLAEEDLLERIQIICKAIGASYFMDEDGEITIESNGCD